MCCSFVFAIVFESRIDMRLFESVFLAWFYLRFFMIRDLVEGQGDQSTNFSFISFFPAGIAEKMKPFVNQVYSRILKAGMLNVNLPSSTGTMMDKTNVYDRQKY